MQTDTGPRDLEEEPYQEAIDLAENCLDRREEFHEAHPGTNSRLDGTSYQRRDLPPEDGDPVTGTLGYQEILEVAEGNAGYLHVKHSWRWDKDLSEPRFVHTYQVTANYGGGPQDKSDMTITNGKLTSARYTDCHNASESILDNPEDALDMVLYVISETRDALLKAPAQSAG